MTFGYPAAGSLKLALANMNVSEEVVPLGDDYSMGPIDPGGPEQRAAWEQEELDEEEPIAPSIEADFWQRVSNWPGRLVAWMSSNSVVELCGLHVLLWRLPDANIHIVDVAHVEFRPDAAPSYDERQAFAIVRDDRIVEHGLLELATPISDVARASFRKNWQRLRQENTSLRVLTDEGVVSVPIDFFDDRIRGFITDEWQPSGRIVGQTLGWWTPRSRLREFHSDTFIFVRLLRLLDSDEFEGETDEEGWSMHTTRVRRRAR